MSQEPSLLPASWQVPRQFRHRLGHRPGRQRVMEAEGHLLVILHEPPEPEETVRDGRFFWRDPEGNWMPKGLRHGEHSLGELIHEYEQAINRLDDMEEEADSADEYFAVLRELHPLVRSANNLHNTLQKAREAAPDDRHLLHVRDASYGMARRAELLYADTRHALDYHMAAQAEEQAESSQQMAAASYRLNLLVAFFFPLATIAGIFGMNLHNPLEDMSRRTGGMLLAVVLLLGLLLGAILTAFVTLPPPKKRKRKRL